MQSRAKGEKPGCSCRGICLHSAVSIFQLVSVLCVCFLCSFHLSVFPLLHVCDLVQLYLSDTKYHFLLSHGWSYLISFLLAMQAAALLTQLRFLPTVRFHNQNLLLIHFCWRQEQRLSGRDSAGAFFPQ